MSQIVPFSNHGCTDSLQGQHSVRQAFADCELRRVEDEFMMAIHGARERSLTDFIRLFQRADARLKYVRTTGGKDGAFQSLLEFRFEDYFSGEAQYGRNGTAVNGFPNN